MRRLRHIDINKVAARVQIIFATLVNYPHQAVPFAIGIRKRAINFPDLQRSAIGSVLNAESAKCKLPFLWINRSILRFRFDLTYQS